MVFNYPLPSITKPSKKSCAVSRREADTDLAWATREITHGQFEAIKYLTGFVYKQRETKTGVKVRVTEWLWVILQMDDYDKAWNKLASKDGIIGGIDYSIDYR
ncbi:hypothetical protein PISMIDRAFT_24004 [Pisolithus microcarpus 441]|uniref:Uncharacterized protein n=1 Tax=Pisolithus microcarpus 441 TaxID=765257 RepID=A0A0C9ZF49_9AGAM|nr:hypothetical protein PISMIDRAFT_24004 [Pisolithus microcarpus 441]